MKTSTLIEALLFGRAEPWTFAEIEKALNISKEEVLSLVSELRGELDGRGICLMETENSLTLGTHPEAHALLKKIYKEELEKSLSKASIETLSVIMYGNDVTRAKIDYIRGVNSSFTLRALLVRGLIERKGDKNRFIYSPSMDLLSNLGVGKIADLPDYEKINSEIRKAEEPLKDTDGE